MISDVMEVYPRVCGGTLTQPRLPPNLGVYPRVCGGTPRLAAAGLGLGGLSPRVRGNPRVGGIGRGNPGSIPACAGEPVEGRSHPRWCQVYPRVCGGTWFGPTCPLRCAGLSPRVRGNHLDDLATAFQRRSIPACAGEPVYWGGVGVSNKVYPRVCGEPSVRPALPRRQEVYPRVCGGTPNMSAIAACGTGLSPRVRGTPTPLGTV